MLLYFAFAWPFSIYKLYKTKSTKGKSILFSLVIILGYIFGIMNKYISDDVNYVVFFYFFDLGLVIIDCLLYFRNWHYENSASSAA